MSHIFLFHEKEPKGRMFKLNDAQKRYDDLVADGWVDSPAKLNLEPETPVFKAEDVASMSPDELVGTVRNMGFIVMTQIEFDAEIEKAKAALFEEVAADQPLKPAESQHDYDNDLGLQFADDPESLTKEQLIEFGNSTYNLTLTRSMKEATLIDKIREAQG